MKIHHVFFFWIQLLVWSLVEYPWDIICGILSFMQDSFIPFSCGKYWNLSGIEYLSFLLQFSSTRVSRYRSWKFRLANETLVPLVVAVRFRSAIPAILDKVQEEGYMPLRRKISANEGDETENMSSSECCIYSTSAEWTNRRIQHESRQYRTPAMRTSRASCVFDVCFSFLTAHRHRGNVFLLFL